MNKGRLLSPVPNGSLTQLVRSPGVTPNEKWSKMGVWLRHNSYSNRGMVNETVPKNVSHAAVRIVMRRKIREAGISQAQEATGS